MKNVFVSTAEGNIQIYVKSQKAVEDSYMRYSLKHFITPYSDGGTYQNQNIWRLNQLFDCKINEQGNFVDNLSYPIVNGGEWECAIKISGTPDFHGGLHGYEDFINVSARSLDKEISLEQNQSFWTDMFTFEVTSVIYRQGTKNEVVATHKKHYTFSREGLKLYQEIIWKQAVEVEFAYVTMLPIRRTSDDTKTGTPITEKVIINDEPAVLDVSYEGHKARTPKKDVRYAKIWSEHSGITAELSIICNAEDNMFFVQNTKVYNKLYYSWIGYSGPYKTKVGEKWEVNSLYDIYKETKGLEVG